MQPLCSREIQGMNSLLNHFDPTSSHDDFLDQILSTVPSSSSSSWPLDLSDETTPPSNPYDSLNLPYHFDDNSSLVGSTLASKLRSHHITADSPAAKAAAAMMLQHQLLLSRRGLAVTASAGDESSGLPHLPLSPSFKSCATPGGRDGSGQALYNGFAGALHVSSQTPNQQPQHFQNPQAQLFQSSPATTAMNPTPPGGSPGGGSSAAAAQPRQRVRARRGEATDPHSIAERLRRERIAERMKSLQELVPNANKTDKASMLDEIIDYVKFLQLQVKVLSMSRLGSASAATALRVTDQGSGDCIQTSAGGRASERRPGTNGTNTTSSSNETMTMTMTEHQVAKLMEEDMGSAMQYLQGKGLCLMPISLATAISTATCHSRNPMIMNPPSNNHHHPMIMPSSNGNEGPSSSSTSVLTAQSAANINIANGVGDGAVKDAPSVSKP